MLLGDPESIKFNALITSTYTCMYSPAVDHTVIMMKISEPKYPMFAPTEISMFI